MNQIVYWCQRQYIINWMNSVTTGFSLNCTIQMGVIVRKTRNAHIESGIVQKEQWEPGDILYVIFCWGSHRDYLKSASSLWIIFMHRIWSPVIGQRKAQALNIPLNFPMDRFKGGFLRNHTLGWRVEKQLQKLIIPKLSH